MCLIQFLQILFERFLIPAADKIGQDVIVAAGRNAVNAEGIQQIRLRGSFSALFQFSSSHFFALALENVLIASSL